MELSISTQLDYTLLCNRAHPISFPRFRPDSHLRVLSSVQPSNFPCSFEHQIGHLVNVVVLMHPPRGLFSAALNIRDQLFRSLSAYQVPQSVQYLFSSREAFPPSGLSASSAPEIVSLPLRRFPRSLLTTLIRRFQELPRTQGPSSSHLSFSSSHIGLHKLWSL